MNAPSTTPREWDAVRTAFSSSIMAGIPISSLAQSLDGAAWPLEGDGETPSDYIDLGYDEVRDLLAGKGRDPALIDRLAEILKETLAFDQPFGDMARLADPAGSAGGVLLRNLARVGIPGDFPMELAAVAQDTRDFCRLEKLETIGAFAVFCQGMAQNVIVGGDFRALLNALSHVDEETLCRFVPLRKGSKSVHIVEALALAVRSRPPEIQVALAMKAGVKVPASESTGISPDLADSAQAELRLHASRLAGGWFKTEFVQMKAMAAAGSSVESFTAPLSNARMEAILVSILRPLLRSREPGCRREKRGFWLRLFGRSQCPA
ncbi:MAG: hypothetical protein WC378_04040 [Opitutaceae bacterium]|jgi:hypothetical protein